MIIAVVFAAIGGAVLGSFLNLVAYRVPRKESIVSPPSRCPSCGHDIRPYDNIAGVSWLLLRGRCRDCKAKIPIRYWLVEVVTGALFGVIVWVLWPDASEMVLGLVLTAFLVPLTLIDLDTRRLPDVLTGPAAVLAVILGTALDPGGEVERLIAGVGAGAFFLVIALIYPAGMGLGDVKLAGVMGLFLGREVIVAIAVAFITGVIVGIAVMVKKGVKEGRKTAIPFGPFLAIGAVTAILAGPQIIHAYTHHTL